MNAFLPEMCLHAESSLQEKTRAICLHSLCGLQQAASTSGESAPRWLSGTQQEVPCVPRNRPQGGRRKSDPASSPQRWYFTRWREQPRAVRAPARSRDTGDQGSGVKASAGPAVRLSSKGGPVVSPPGSAESGQFCYCFLGTGCTTPTSGSAVTRPARLPRGFLLCVSVSRLPLVRTMVILGQNLPGSRVT